MKLAVTEPDDSSRKLYPAVLTMAGFIGILWLVWICDVLFTLQLFQHGVHPLTPSGLKGILFGPLIHGSFKHLFANTLPVFILGTSLLYVYPKSARIALPVIWLGSGIGVWLFARDSYHIGASGLTHGLLFFTFVIGVLRRDRQAIALSMLVFFLYGGMIWSIFPQQQEISFEYHLFGALTGFTLAFFLKGLDPAPAPKSYDWETVEENDEQSAENERRDQ